MLREDIEQYTKLTGEDGWNVPVMKVGAYLDGYNKGLSVLDKIRAEIEQAADKQFQIAMGVVDLNVRYNHIQMENAYRHTLNIIDKYKAEAVAESEG